MKKENYTINFFKFRPMETFSLSNVCTTRGRDIHGECRRTGNNIGAGVCKIKRLPTSYTCTLMRTRVCRDVFIGRRSRPPSFIFVPRDYRE